MGDVVPSRELSKKKKRESARILYMTGATMDDILDLVDCDTLDLREWIYGKDGKGKSRFCWAAIRERGEDSLISAFIKSKAPVLEAVGGKMLQLTVIGLNKLIEDHKSGDKTMTVKDVDIMMSAMERLDKVVRLEDGKPTEIFSKQAMTVEEARRILDEDPFKLGIMRTEALVKEAEEQPLDLIKEVETVKSMEVKPKEVYVAETLEESGDGEHYIINTEAPHEDVEVKK